MEPYHETQALEELVHAIASKAISWQGTAFRVVGSQYANKRDLLSGHGTRRFGGRWTPPWSFATVHASLDVRTAMAESLGTQRVYGIDLVARLPLTLVAIEVQLEKLIDLTDDSVLIELTLTRRKLLRCRWRESMEKGREALTQALGRIAFQEGMEGLLVPSAQSRKGRNLVIFPDNLQRGSSMAIQNEERLPR